MSMTDASAAYFADVAGQWDEIRAGYFGEAVRAAAIRRAYLHPDMEVADVGAGTGYVAAGLAPLVRQVTLLDASPEMLAVARRNLQGVTNVVFQQAEGLALPLPDGSQDAVFANMYLHHIPEPLEALREMVRVLRPGGRLVITDMDAHPYAWLKAEMADVWQGFERPQVRAWFEQVGLVNVIVDCSGEACHSESAQAATPAAERQAEISIFVAVGTKAVAGAVEAVGEHYAAIARSGGSCCSPAPAEALDAGNCCAPVGLLTLDEIQVPASQDSVRWDAGYTDDERQAAPGEVVEISLACGNPTAFAALQPGEVVLDIGSGGGLDAFLAARQVGPAGKVIGVDMTAEMLERARRSAERAGLSQVEFREGRADALPVVDGSVDVIISNCVINLTPDKGRVFREAFRVMKPGGRLEVSDMVTSGSFPASRRSGLASWGGCIDGALPQQEYLDLAAQAGFVDIRTQRSSSAGLVDGVEVYSLQVSARRPA